MEADKLDFEFPNLIANDVSSNSGLPNNIVFCGKVMHVHVHAHAHVHAPSVLPKSHSLVKSKSDRPGGLIKPFSRRSDSCSKYRNVNGLFGILKFPVEMDMNNIKMRQARREPAPLPRLPESVDGDWVSGGDGDGGSGCWKMVPPLRRRGPLMSVLVKATFGCISPL